MADNLNGAAHDLARVLNSIASALEPAAAEPSRPRRRAASRRARRPPASPPTQGSAPAPVTDRTVRAAMLELGPATSAQIAAHINQTAGHRVVDGRSIGSRAQRLGARVVTRRGQRLYRL